MQQMPFDPSRAQSRATHVPVAILLHEVNEPLAYIDAAVQQQTTFPSAAHQSFHYAVNADGVHAYVPMFQAAHAVANTDTLAPWPVALARPGVDADLYTVNIAVSIGTLAIMPNPCTPDCGRAYSVTLQRNLQVLLNNIAAELGLDLTADGVVWKHGLELCDLDLAPLLLAVPTQAPAQEDFLCDRLEQMPEGESEAPVLVGRDCKAYTAQQVVVAGLCDRLAALPLGESETPMLVGSDCALYPYPTEHPWQINANGTGRQTQYGIASGLNSLASGGVDGNGGYSNEASGDGSAAIGGYSNEASGGYSAAIGGYSNEASGDGSAAIGGSSNEVSGDYSAAIGGGSNVASGNVSAAIGGDSNVASGDYSAAIGGYSNVATHIRAVIAGGQNMASVADDTLHCAKLAILSIPTSAVGLASGMIWSDSGTLKIVP